MALNQHLENTLFTIRCQPPYLIRSTFAVLVFGNRTSLNARQSRATLHTTDDGKFVDIYFVYGSRTFHTGLYIGQGHFTKEKRDVLSTAVRANIETVIERSTKIQNKSLLFLKLIFLPSAFYTAGEFHVEARRFETHETGLV